MIAKSISSLDDVLPQEWDALVGENDPFVEHAFLRLLEDSGSVGGASGWEPAHVTVRSGTELVGALPLYVKTHSYGEYIFDWSWADAAMRAGIPYYPKLVSMVPVTPVTGRRFLVHPDADYAQVVEQLLQGCLQVAEARDVSSIHLLFLNEQEQAEVAKDGRFIGRLSHQFHWHNRDYQDFAAYLADFRSSMRKKARRERRVARESGLEFRMLEGDEVNAATWQRLYTLYLSGCGRKGSHPYLTRRFFELAPNRISKRALVFGAYNDGELVASSLNFAKGAHVYGRYWGCDMRYEMLHFELCYYWPIEHAIKRRARRFEAGAQGMHKLRRGLMPSSIHSAHWVAHPLLRAAIAEAMPREAAAVRGEMAALAHHGPFRRDNDAPEQLYTPA